MSEEQHNPQYQDSRAPVNVGWHLKKEVNLTIIISVLGFAIAAVTGYTDLKKEIALIQADVGVLHQRDKQQINDNDKQLLSIRSQYDRLEAKLDRLIERGAK